MHFSEEKVQLLQNEISREYRILTSKDSLPIFEIHGYVTNSKYSPKNEARKISEKFLKKNYYHVLIGIGSGYIAEEIYHKLGDNEKLLILEPNKEIFEKLLEISGLSFLKDFEKVTFITGLEFDYIEQFIGSIVSEYNNRLQVITSPNYEKIYPLFVKETLTLIKELLMLQIVNNNTLKKFYEDWQENLISNLFYIFQSAPFKCLKKRLNIPIVVVSGGPSLIKQLEIIKKNRNKIFLICAGSTINTLLEKNITPDAIVAIDGSYSNYLHFEKIDYLNIPIFYSSKLHKNILKAYKGEKIAFNDKGDVQTNDLLKNIIGYELGDVSPGPSVAIHSLDIALQLTTGPICMIGQDLAYTDNVSHALGNKNYSLLDEKEIAERQMFYVQGYNGGKVLTDYPFYSMKKTFEYYFKNLSCTGDINRTFNCTEGGALIEGINNIPFQEFINNYCQLNVSNDFESLLNKSGVNRTSDDWKYLYKRICDEKRKSRTIKKICKKAIEILDNIDKNQPKFSYSDSKKLDEIDKKLKQLLENEFLFFIFGETIFKIDNHYLEQENETKEEKQKRIYFKSVALYEGVYNAANLSLGWFDELLLEISCEL